MTWDDPYLGVQQGERCPEVHPGISGAQCVLHAGHTSLLYEVDIYHRHSSPTDGRSVSWYTKKESADEPAAVLEVSPRAS